MRTKTPPAQLAGIVAGFAAVVTALMILLAPGSEPAQVNETAILAVVEEIRPAPYRIKIDSFGRVEPRTSTSLVAQLGGRVLRVSPQFRPGGRFAEGEILVWIEPDDYRNAATIAQSQLARARSELAREQAMSAQALRDWRRLGSGAPPSPLTLREPQLNKARAELAAARARLGNAELDIDRTTVLAPYSGRLRAQRADIGQVVRPGAVLAEIYSDESIEIRLPVLLGDLPYLPGIPAGAEAALAGGGLKPGDLPSVALRPSGGGPGQWRGFVVRHEAGIERSSYQRYLVARISANAQGRYPEVGQYLDAVIDGIEVDRAVVIPDRALYRDSFAWLARPGTNPGTGEAEMRLDKRVVEPAWRNDDTVLVGSGLGPGDRLVTTRLGFVRQGALVTDEDRYEHAPASGDGHMPGGHSHH